MTQHIDWLTPTEFEKIYRIKKSTQAKMRMRGKLPYCKFGKFVYYDQFEIDALLKNHTIGAKNG